MKNEILNMKNSKEWAEFENYYNSSNIFKQIGLFRFEDFHTNILKSLFEETNTYGLGFYSIKKLFELITLKDENNLVKDFIDSQIEIHNLNVETQKYKDKTRLDLFISFTVDNLDYNIILENKIFSEENETQCKEYYRVYGDNDKRNTYIYLSLEENPIISSDKFICITYQELIDYVVEPCSYRDNSNGKMLSLCDYLASYSQLYEYMDYFSLANHKQVLPITSVGRELTMNLYIKHKEVIEAIILENNTEFYRENEITLKALYYNLFLLSDLDSAINKSISSKIRSKLFNIRCTFDGMKCSFKECTILILKYLIDKEIIQNENDLNVLNECMPNGNYFAAVFDLNIPHAEFYTNNYKGIGKLEIDKKELYYYTGPMVKEEIKQYYDAINNNFNNALVGIVEIED